MKLLTPEEQVLKALYGKDWDKIAPVTPKALLLDIVDKITELESENRALRAQFCEENVG